MATDKILVIEKDEKLKRQISEHLSGNGYEIYYSNQVQDAIKNIENNDILVVIVDSEHFEGNVEKLIRNIKEINFSVEIILIINSDDRKNLFKAFNAGVYNFLEKPIDPLLLLIYIKKALERIRTLAYFRNVKNLIKNSIKSKIADKLDLPKYILHTAVHNIIMIVDNDLFIHTVNEGAKRILGYKKEFDFKDKHLSDFFYKRDYNTLKDKISNSNRPGERTFEIKWKARSGETVPISLDIYELNEDNGEKVGFLIIGFDTSKQKKLQQQMSHAEKLATIGKIAAGVAHEINNPIASITACAQSLLQLVNKDNECAQSEPIFSRYLNIITEQAFRCKNIIDNLLDYSRQYDMTVKQVDLYELIREALELTIHQVKKESQNVKIEQCNEIGYYNGDPNKLKQLFVNILSNAFDAIEIKKEKGKIIIKLDKKRDKIIVQVRDNGIGLAAKYKKSVFDPFFTTKDTGLGTGLGLSISKEIVDLHSGEITFKSKKDEYTIVTVFLPIQGIGDRNLYEDDYIRSND